MTLDPRAESIVGDIEEKARARGARHGKIGWRSTSVDMPWQIDAEITRAAKRRGISKTGYVRRVLAYALAREIDASMSAEQMMALLPPPLPYGRRSYKGLPTGAGRDDGEGFGDWSNHRG